MTRFTFRLPDIGEGIAEAEIVGWHVKIGDRIEEDQELADMMTDKATVAMESPVSGTVVELAGEPGDMVPIGSALVVIETEGEGSPHGSAAGAPQVQEVIEAETPGAEEVNEPVSVPAAPVEVLPSAPSAPSEPEQSTQAFDKSGSNGDITAATILASPAVRARAKELGIDLAQVKTAAKDNLTRIRHADLDAFLLYGAGQGYRPAGAGKARADEAVKVIGMRRRIAENMAASKRHIPHFTYVEEIDVTALEAMRADLNSHRGDNREGGRPKLTLLPLLIVAICKALPDFPMINARYDDEAGVVTRHGAVHLGMATQTEAGLMVPVIRDAQAKNLWQLSGEIVRLADASRSGKARSDELSGSTLTVTSLGPLGGVATTPVINRPEVAIIGPNRIVERPVFVTNSLGGKEIVAAKLMNLSISCDHRVVDGWDAARFVQAVKRLLETPVLLLAA